MKHYLKNGELFAFAEDGSQDDLITKDMVPATDAEVAAIQNPEPTPAESWTKYLERIQDALAKSDVTMSRIQEAVVLGKTTWQAADVIAYVGWRSKLREVQRSQPPSGIPTTLPDLPDFPGYPAGT